MSATSLRPGELLSQGQLHCAFLATFFSWIAISVTWPLYLGVCQELGLDKATLGLVLGLGGLGQMASSRIITPLCHRMGKRNVASLAQIFAALFWGLCFLQPGFFTVALASVFTGVSFSAPAVHEAYYGAHTTQEARSKVFLRMAMCIGAGCVTGPLIYGTAKSSGFSAVQLCMLAACLYAAVSLLQRVLLVRTEESISASSASAGDRQRALVWTSTAVWSFVAMGALIATANLLGYFFPVSLQQRSSDFLMASMFSFMGLTNLLAPMVAAVGLRFLSEPAWRVLGAALITIGCALCVLTSPLWLVVVGFVLWALFYDAVAPLFMAQFSKEFPAEDQTRIANLRSLMNGGLGFVANIGGGALYESIGPQNTFALNATCACLILLSALVLAAPRFVRANAK